MPMIQLTVSPTEPLGPPPRSWKVVSSGAMVWPAASWKVTLRQTSRPPSVTMNEGMPT